MAYVELKAEKMSFSGVFGLTGLLGYLYFPAFLIMASTGSTITGVEASIIRIMSFGSDAIEVTSDGFRVQAVAFSVLSFVLMIMGALMARNDLAPQAFAKAMKVITPLSYLAIVPLSYLVAMDMYEFGGTGYQPMGVVGMLIYASSFSLVHRLMK